MLVLQRADELVYASTALLEISLELLLDRATTVLVELGELAQGGQILQRLQPEQLQERRARAVEDRPARLVLLAEDADEIALEQQLEHRAAVHAADVVHLGPRDRLPIRDDRERLDLRTREAHRLLARHVSHERRVHGARAEDPAAGDLVELYAATLVLFAQLLEHLRDLPRRRARELADLS